MSEAGVEPNRFMRRFVPIEGFEDYLVGRDGRVFSLISGEFLCPWCHESGHLYVQLTSRDGEREKLQVHRLVLLAFVGTPAPGDEGCHADGNPANNDLSNLRWAPRSANIDDYRRLHRRHWAATLTLEQAQQIRAEYGGRRGEQRALARKYGVSKDVITDLLSGRTYREPT